MNNYKIQYNNKKIQLIIKYKDTYTLEKDYDFIQKKIVGIDNYYINNYLNDDLFLIDDIVKEILLRLKILSKNGKNISNKKILLMFMSLFKILNSSYDLTKLNKKIFFMIRRKN